ncbi:hypothetical protein GCK72_004922 [Caenorhabditis remanei]|uniref:Transcription factor AP-2 C-terminal domain-containing protein n=1 Tax=Caenorhabditis remanei TaxID=31234 RepID=A0A6A5HDH0_CAERE|nr:hypothetical protein GCK72_004922 [Caenorhabditis remanei]KAF1764971.1 hypothetical protein GCK72_004922 [Caenorhabditis remanei]
MAYLNSHPYSPEYEYPVFSDLTNQGMTGETSEDTNKFEFSQNASAESSGVNRKRKTSNSESHLNPAKFTLLESSPSQNLGDTTHGVRYQAPPLDSMYQVPTLGFYADTWNQPPPPQFHQQHPQMPLPQMHHEQPLQLYPLDGYYQQPESARTPPMTEQQEYTLLSLQTPVDIRQPPGGSLMYTPLSDVSSTTMFQASHQGGSPGNNGFAPTSSDRPTVTNDVFNSTEQRAVVPAQQKQKKGMKVIDGSDILTVSEFYSHGNAATILKTFATHYPDGNNPVMEVDGRLPAVGCRSKYTVTVDEIRRRVGAPEFLNISGLYTFLRKSKKKANNVNVKKMLDDHDIKVLKMQRQKVATRFSPMLEEECLHMAKDLEKLTERFFPIMTVSHQLVHDLLNKNTLEKTVGYLKSTLAIIDFIINSLQARQPKVHGMQEKLKGNKVDVSYHLFSVLTHGFGHANSLNHYKLYRGIFERALLMCTQIQHGKKIEPIKELRPGEKPFALMRPDAYARWQKDVYIEKEKNRMMATYHDYQNHQKTMQHQNQMPTTSSG